MAFLGRQPRRLALLAVVLIIIYLLLQSPSRKDPTHVSSPSRYGDAGNAAEGTSHGYAKAAPESEPKSQRPENTGTPRSRISEAMQKLLTWDPPREIQNHYPPYSDYDNRDYDPNRWEAFEQNQAYYWNGTMKGLSSQPAKPAPYNPYPNYTNPDREDVWMGRWAPCEAPDGSYVEPGSNWSASAYPGVPKGFPEPNTGSFEALGLDSNSCFDRYSRLGTYGLNSTFDFEQTDWLDLQNKCLRRNAARYWDASKAQLGFALSESEGPATPLEGSSTTKAKRWFTGNSNLAYKYRTAILIRTWDNYEYQPNDIQAIRSLITELNLLSGGEYHVFLFVNVKDMEAPIFTDRGVHDELLSLYVPEELRSIAILWSEAVCQNWYPNVGEWSVYFQQWMPLQWFSQTHPEFEYIWNWEMDARYIGNHYHFLESIARFAKAQPRKHLWERNSRYYFPKVHGSWEKFTADTRRIVAESPHMQTVWGPQPWTDSQNPVGPKPPTTEAEDNYKWGIDEEADFVSLLPMWDPRETWWSYRDKLWGYDQHENSTDERPYPHVPRRTFINTSARLSKTLLDTMHRENLAGVSMASEMWPSSISLQHGFKAVYAPHPIWFSQKWPTDYLEETFNADGWGAGSKPGSGNTDDGRGAGFDPELEKTGKKQIGTGPNGEGLAGRWGQERDAPYNPDREHYFGGWSWYFWSDFPKVLYRRWLGWNAGFAIVTIEGSQSSDDLREVEWSEWEGENGRLCFPAMLLHPVKNVQEGVDT